MQRYSEFVQQVTSTESTDLVAFTKRCQDLQESKLCNVPLLMTSAIGLSSEGGEFSEIVKKLVFQGKPLTEDLVFHMKRELGDILWYWTNACRALNLDPQEVMEENVRKLQSRYPQGTFDTFFSEHRKKGDL
jgi:NTP pyrophosphatase (non-canonical NTP hydrolase)|uniref:NTP pyrophosphohydrolase MazG-like domain-containing protein n=1 Tax=viral metagenome TaxID=1070528 RepID=A0A6C0ICN1_9ZZZZ